MCFKQPGPNWIQRPLVIDGCNIGRSASGLSRTNVDCAGLVSVVRWLLHKEFDITVFLPVVYNNVYNCYATNAGLLQKLEKLGIVTFTPARSGRGLRKAFINYDDLYVACYATRHGGAILSGDKFKDILNQSCYSDFHNVIQNRTIDVRFRPLTHDFVKVGDDFYYRHAPELFTYDYTDHPSESVRRKLFVKDTDPDYQLALAHRNLTTKERRKYMKNELEAILIRLSLGTGKQIYSFDHIPITEASNRSPILNITDVFDEESCAAFFKRYPPTTVSRRKNTFTRTLSLPCDEESEGTEPAVDFPTENLISTYEEPLIQL